MPVAYLEGDGRQIQLIAVRFKLGGGRLGPAMSRIQFGLIVAAILVGLTAGIGAYTFVYAKGYSYLTNDPAACANCHIMRDHFAAWQRSSHRAVAVCNDCHTPPGLVPKYMTKARNGFWHSFYFTTGNYPVPVQITPRDHDIVELACRKCHAELTSSIDRAHGNSGKGGLSCTACHNEVGHLE